MQTSQPALPLFQAAGLQPRPEQTGGPDEPSVLWSLPGHPVHDAVTRGCWHQLKYKHPRTVDLENHPNPLEVEKLRHRKVK